LFTGMDKIFYRWEYWWRRKRVLWKNCNGLWRRCSRFT